MYYPYLRGKQFELLALREFAQNFHRTQKIVPIIEPVKISFNSIKLAVETMFRHELRFALVLNPNEGDFKTENKDILSEITSLQTSDKWVPAFAFYESGGEIISKIDFYGFKEAMIIFKDGIDTNNFDISFLGDDRIRYIVNGNPDSRAVRKYLSGLTNKRIIRLDNCFNDRPRNVDYLKNIDEKFTEAHRTFIEDGFYGFSDYVTLPKRFIDSGMLPYAVAIHLTYEKNEDEIYVHHFMSETNDDQSNVSKKFDEAARKIEPFFIDKEHTAAVDELININKQEQYPGLGVIKKLSIKNHLELINKILI